MNPTLLGSTFDCLYMRRKEDLPDWMLFPSERDSTNETEDWVKLDSSTLTQLDDLVESSHNQSRADVIANLVYDEWVSECSSKRG